MFDTVLVANRGEIARRVLRACRELGVATVAVYSEADAEAPFVQEADQAVRIGPASPAESYLDQVAILEAAGETGAEAIHPGYGFLSENAGFAEACRKAGLTFVGPSPEAMATLGDKVQARQLALQQDVPVSPGTEGALEGAKEAREVADEVGYPIILKAAAGGGGMGMRVVREPEGMEQAFQEASQQSQAAFGNGDLFLERFLERPRHIEVQVVGDADGQVVHLGERECSIQRRHQKLVEEAPSPVIDADRRAELGEMACRLAEAGGYTNAGTLEFLYQDGEVFFNEMNTRLQVEHPVTELVTDLDLVHAQLRVAAGEPLSFDQDDVRLEGHAIEVRINAEDPYQGFLPRFGTISRFEPPQGRDLRFDHGIEAGWTVPSDYDSLLGKLIAWGPDRRKAAQRLAQGLATLKIGATTNLPLQRRILADEAFLAGDLSTSFLEDRGLLEALETEGKALQEEARVRAAALTAALAMGPRGGIGTLYHAHQRPRRLDEDTGGGS